MADDITLTSTSPAGPANGTKQVTDEHVTRGHMPVVKLALSADGSATHATVDADGVLVNLGANNDVTVTGTVAVTQSGTWDEVGINDSGNSLTVDAPVGTPVFVRLSDGSSAIATLPVSAASLPLPSGASTLAEQQSQTNHLATIAGDTTDIETAVELLDDTVKVLGTDTYTEATSKGLVIGAVRRDADTTLADTTNEFAPLQVDASGRLKVEAFSGETLPVSLTSTTVTGTVAVTQSGTWDEVGINDSGNVITVDGSGSAGSAASGVVTVQGVASMTPIQVGDNSSSLTVDNAGTFATQIDGTALTRLTDIETNTDSGAVVGNGAAATAQRVTLANDSTGIVALTTSTASIGKLAANSGVDIGDVDITSIAAGDNNIGNVDIVTLPRSQSGPGNPGTAVDSYTHAAINISAGADTVLVSSAASKQIWVYGIGFTLSVAGTVSFQDEDNTAITGVMPFAALSGMAVPPSGNFSMPIWKLGTDKDLEVDLVTADMDGWIDYAIISV